MKHLEGILSSLPTLPGVYIMKDGEGRAIYIGKAKNLKERVRSYIKNSKSDRRPQIPYLLNELSKLDYFVTKNEYEALILENALIKKHKPKYNILLKDDKNYASIRIDPRERFPKLTYTRRISNDGAIYFGPFVSTEALRQTKRLVHKLFLLRDCSDEKFRRHSSRPCLNYYMKLCSGPCAGRIEEDRYREAVKGATMFLKGNTKEVIKLLTENMNKASEEMRYEDAAHYRDQIRFLQKQASIEGLFTAGLKNMDIIGFYREGTNASFVVLFSRGGGIIDKSEYFFNKVTGDDKEVVGEFLKQFYNNDRSSPEEILIPIRFEGLETFSRWLSDRLGRKTKVTVPRRGGKAKLIEVARENARESFRRLLFESQRESYLLHRLKELLSLSNLPERIECFDVSNIQGNTAVASMVRFENGKPVKSRYKRFRIKTVYGVNDYAMLYEVLIRRLKRMNQEGWELPDLILIDGGKGHLNTAYRVISEFGLLGRIDLVSIAKGRKTQETDKLYTVGRKDPVPVRRTSEELFFLMRVRDEAHRFAITYHKKLRALKALSSELDLIPEVGKKRKKVLLSHYSNLSEIKEASIEELSSLPTMTKRAAEEIRKYLKESEDGEEKG